jgi:hypothetical protein
VAIAVGAYLAGPPIVATLGTVGLFLVLAIVVGGVALEALRRRRRAQRSV